MTESRRVAAFKQHPFQGIWAALLEMLGSISAEENWSIEQAQETARLKKAIAYIDSLLHNVDPELIPSGTWSSFHAQVQQCFAHVEKFSVDKDFSEIDQANVAVDSLLSFLRPYEGNTPLSNLASDASSVAYANQFGQYAEVFQSQSQLILQQMRSSQATAVQVASELESKNAKVGEYEAKLFTDIDGTESIQARIASFLEQADRNAKQINDFHAELIVGTTQSPATQARIKAAEIDVEGTRIKINGILDALQQETRELTAFHTKIFGAKDDAGKPGGGLELELENRLTQLAKYEAEQNVRHTALSAQIEALLPGATSAGLASAYASLKDNFTRPIANYTKLFYGALLFLVFAAMVMAVDNVTLHPSVSIQFVKVAEWDLILRALLYKAPFVVPVVWLALFSSKRRSQYERLQQEYAHKEALARSYESYKIQLQELQGNSEELQKELIAKAIAAIAYNASATLDGDHQERLPIQQLWESFKPDDVKKILDMFKDMLSKAKGA